MFPNLNFINSFKFDPFRSKRKSSKEMIELLDFNPSTITRTLSKFQKEGAYILLFETRGSINHAYVIFENEQELLKKSLKESM